MRLSPSYLCKSMLVAAFASAIALPAMAQEITGAGSSFGAPIYGKWGEATAKAAKITLNYQSIGSGAGINQINNRTVDFGASDMPVAAADLATHKLMQFPTVIGGVVMVVNLPGITTDQLKLDGAVLADIYLGKISKWNDAKIAALNPGLKLPALAIATVHRADGSGTTFVFTDYLGMQSAEWKANVGSSTSVKWPGGAGGKGNEGVSATVKQVKGAIGYVESAFAIQNKLTTTLLKNKAGSFVKADMASFAAAASNADWSRVQNFAINLNDQPGAKSWPIESATFVLLPTDPKDAGRSATVRKFFDWSFANGGKIANDLLYVTLPTSVQDAVRAAWKAAFKG